MSAITGPRRRLRTRLLIAMVAIAFGVLVVSMAAAAGIARQSASDTALDDLKGQAPTVAQQLTDLSRRFRRVASAGQQPRGVCRLISGVLRVSGASVVLVEPDGRVQTGVGGLLGARCIASGATPLPRDLGVSDLDVDQLRRGATQSDRSGDTAFVARPLTAVAGRTPVLLLTQQIATRPLGRAGPFLIAAGALALLVAAVVSAYLARRLTRPLAAMETTAQRIAAGDLSARVDPAVLSDDELASLARSLDAMADQLERARGHERAFLLSISHDLRTPLTSIRGYAAAMTDGTIETPAERARAAEVIASEARRLDRLVADLLELARLDARQFSLSPHEVDARSVVQDAAAGFVPLARDWGVDLAVADGGPVMVTTDPERVAQVTANLVENALKYATGAVQVDVVRTGDIVELRVDDDGPGVDPTERERVFDRLYTARDTPGRSVGTGIGLAVVKELAGALGGSARCEDRDRGGTRFVVTFPG